jgi:ribosome-associated protein
MDGSLSPGRSPLLPDFLARDGAHPLMPMPDPAARALAETLAQIADKKKAEDVLILDVSGRHSLFDFFVIATAQGSRQAAVVGDEAMTHARRHKIGRHLEVAADWVCGDFGDVVLHVFTPEARRFYDLEHLWSDAPRVSFVPQRAPGLAASESA